MAGDAQKTCGGCKFRGAPITRIDDNFEDVQTGFFLCEQIKHFDKTYRGTELYPKGDGAVVVDGSDYHAALCVENEFGCNRWAAKP